MYKIELTKGQQWNAPAIETHFVASTTHMAEIERRARALLENAQRKPNRQTPDGYRVVNIPGGRVVASSAAGRRDRA